MPKTSKAQLDASSRYIMFSVDSIAIRVPKGQRSIIKAHAEKRNESMNAFIVRAINETISKEG